MTTESSSSNTAIVVVFIMALLAVAAFFMYRGGMFGGKDSKSLDINIRPPSAMVLTLPANEAA